MNRIQEIIDTCLRLRHATRSDRDVAITIMRMAALSGVEPGDCMKAIDAAGIDRSEVDIANDVPMPR